MPSLREDDRAIEGLPIRLVIALVVGVASLGVMMQMLGDVPELTEEVDVQPDSDVVELPTDGETITLTVIDSDGNSISDATVVVAGGTATLDGVETATTGADGTAEVTVDPSLGPNQQRGTLTIDVKPPAGSQYADERRNTEILVVENTTEISGT